MTLPPSQYVDDRNLRARQRLWRRQEPPFNVVDWVLGLSALPGADRLLGVGGGNGDYLAALAQREAPLTVKVRRAGTAAVSGSRAP